MNPSTIQEHAVTAELRARLVKHLQPQQLTLTDESHLHAGHAGAQGGARHYRAQIVTPRFSGLSRVARHRLVYSALQDLLPHPIHALALELLAPEEVVLSSSV
jgi:BolA family transcriptional regulator, general stress-responsive regulator